MLTTILSLLSSSSVGSILGSVFSWLNKRNEIAETKLKLDHDYNMAVLSNEQQRLMASENRATIREAGEQAVDKTEADAFVESQRSANQKPVGKWAELVWSAVRPLITAWLLGITSYIAYRLFALIGGFTALPLEELVALFGAIIHELLGLTGYAVGWWFGARGTSKRKAKD